PDPSRLGPPRPICPHFHSAGRWFQVSSRVRKMDAPSTPCRLSKRRRPHRRRKDHAVDGDQVKEWPWLSGYQNPCPLMKALKMIVKYRDIRNPDAKSGGSETDMQLRGIGNLLRGS